VKSTYPQSSQQKRSKSTLTPSKKTSKISSANKKPGFAILKVKKHQS